MKSWCFGQNIINALLKASFKFFVDTCFYSLMIRGLKGQHCQCVKPSNLSSINCFDSYGNGQTNPVIFTGQTHVYQQRLGIDDVDNVAYQNTEPANVFYNPYPEMRYNFPISSNFFK